MLKKRNIIVFATCLLLFAVLMSAIGVTSTAAVFFGENVRRVPVYGVYKSDADEKVIALTFDAAWGADKTQGILDIMNTHNAKGTFFLVGFWIDKFQTEVKAIADAGFDIGNHSKNHLNMPRLSESEINNEISSVNNQVFDLTGKTPKYFRAPFGDYNNKLLNVIDNLNMVGVQWSIDSLDWKGLSASEIVKRIVPKAKSGDIVLFHNNSDHILDALPLVLIALKNKGFKFVTMSQMVATKNYTIDSQGIQHTK